MHQGSIFKKPIDGVLEVYPRSQ